MIEELYDRYYEELLIWCKSMTGGKEALSEDLIQEVFLRAMKHERLLIELGERQQRN
ncbi:MAG: sigma factor [Eubacteriales bacterium]|nr:sigma factor [Eubacteriales bacterium]